MKTQRDGLQLKLSYDSLVKLFDLRRILSLVRSDVISATNLAVDMVKCIDSLVEIARDKMKNLCLKNKIIFLVRNKEKFLSEFFCLIKTFDVDHDKLGKSP